MVEVKKTSKKAKKTVAKKVEEPTVVENKEESTAVENKEETTSEPVLGESKVEESDNEEIKEDLNKIAEDEKDEVAVKAEPIVEHKTENKPTNKSKIIRNFTATWNGVTMDF